MAPPDAASAPPDPKTMPPPDTASLMMVEITSYPVAAALMMVEITSYPVAVALMAVSMSSPGAAPPHTRTKPPHGAADLRMVLPSPDAVSQLMSSPDAVAVPAG